MVDWEVYTGYANDPVKINHRKAFESRALADLFIKELDKCGSLLGCYWTASVMEMEVNT